MFVINIHYKTGDSFESYETEDLIGHQWQDLDIVKQNLQRIKNLHDYLLENSKYEEPLADAPQGVSWDHEHRLLMIELIDDKKEPIKIHPFWTGYFERIISAEIQMPDMKVEFS